MFFFFSPPEARSFRGSGRIFLSLLAALLVLFAAAPASARIDLRADLGYDGTYAAGSWVPLRILLENLPDPKDPQAGIEGFRGQLVVDVQDLQGVKTEYVREIELPAHSRKQVEMEIMLSEMGHSMIVRLVDERGQEVLVKDPGMLFPSGAAENLRQSIRRAPTVLLLARPLENLSYPTRLPVGAANIKSVFSGDLPSDYRGYDTVRLLVVQHNLSELLQDEQLEAIERWVHMGGRLAVIPTRHHAEIAADPWLAELLPAPVEGVDEVSAGRLSGESGENVLLMTRWGEPHAEARMIWENEGRTIALERPVGMGRVIGLGLDTSSATGGDDTALARRVQALLESLIFMPGPEELRARHYWSTADVDPDFINIMILPNQFVVTALIAAFVLIAGPANFYYLRRKRRLELAWLTIPALSVVFFLAVYFYGVAAKGGDQHYASAEILHVGEGSDQGLLLWSSIQFSPSKRAYQMNPGESGVMLPLLRYYNDPGVGMAGMYPPPFLGGMGRGTPQIGGGPIARLITSATGADHLLSFVDQWKMAFYQGEAPVQMAGRIEGEVVMDNKQSLHLQLRNGTPAVLSDARLSVGVREERLGEIRPGEALTGSVAEMWHRAVGGTASTVEEADGKFHESAEALMRQGAVDAYPNLTRQSPQRRIRLLARQQQWESGTEIIPPAEHRKVAGMVEVDLPLRLKGRVPLHSDSILRREIYAYDPLAAQFFSGMGDFCDLQNSEMEVLFGPPRLVGDAKFVGGELVVHAQTGRSRLVASAFNYLTGAWDEFGTLDPQEVNSVAVDKIESAIDPAWVNPFEPVVRVKLAATTIDENRGMFAGQYGYGVAIEDVEATMEFEGDGGENATVAGNPEPESRLTNTQ